MRNLARNGYTLYTQAMKTIYQAKPDFGDFFARAGMRQAQAARAAGISVFTLAHIAAGRQRASATTAHRIAAVYASAAGGDQDAALGLLFEAITDDRPERQRGADGKFVKAEP